jgi:hypothetical protein
LNNLTAPGSPSKEIGWFKAGMDRFTAATQKQRQHKKMKQLSKSLFDDGGAEALDVLNRGLSVTGLFNC